MILFLYESDRSSTGLLPVTLSRRLELYDQFVYVPTYFRGN